MNPFFRTDLSISDSLKTVRKSVLIYETIIDNETFLKLDELNQDYIIRLTSRRNLFFRGKWVSATHLRDQRKGKIKTPLLFRRKYHDAYLSHVKVQITASQKDIYLVLVYGITEHPMMLAMNKEIQSKEDVINVAKTYFSR